MDTKSLLFYVFSAVLLLASFKVITAKSTVHSALYLVLAFFQAAGIWVLLKAEFLAIALVLVYVGAVMVLFLFVVMMLDVNVQTVRTGFWKHFPLAGALGALVAVEMTAVLMDGFRLAEEPKQATAGLQVLSGALQYSNTKVLGKLMYSAYIYPVQIAAVLLLVAIIAAIALTLRERKDSKYADPASQVRVKAKDRMVLVSYAATENVASTNSSARVTTADAVSGVKP
jgi:NADH-quinone oxidoreductase subunit J